MARKPETDRQPKKPQGLKSLDARAARLAAALRENLRRRKAQERQRTIENKAEPRENKNG
jgi:hypothetical protein